MDGRRRSTPRITLGADKAYDAEQFVARSASDERDAAHCHRWTYQQNGKPRAPPSTGARPAMPATPQPAHPQAHRGGVRLDQDARRAWPRSSSEAVTAWTLPSPWRLAAYNLIRLPKLLAAPA